MKFILLIGFSLFITSCYSQNNTSSKTLNSIDLPGDGGWDYLYVDEDASRLYVSHGNMVQVVDLNSNELIATIPDTKGVHGIAIAHDLGKGFISDGRDTAVTIFDLKSNQTIAKVKVTGMNPDAILYDEFSHQVFVYNGRTSNATVIDAKSNNVIATIELDGKPEFSVTNSKGKVYVNIEDKSEISMINTTTNKVEKTWSISPGQEPSGLAFDVANQRLFAVCDNKLMVVVNSENGKVVTTVPIGEGVDGVAFDPVLKRIYSSNGEGTMTIIQQENADSYKILETVNTQKGARTIALNSRTHRIYLPTAEYGETPAATKEQPRPRASIKPGSFKVLVVGDGQ